MRIGRGVAAAGALLNIYRFCAVGHGHAQQQAKAPGAIMTAHGKRSLGSAVHD